MWRCMGKRSGRTRSLAQWKAERSLLTMLAERPVSIRQHSPCNDVL